MSDETVLILHRKSSNEDYVKEAVKEAKKNGIKLRVLTEDEPERAGSCHGRPSWAHEALLVVAAFHRREYDRFGPLRHLRQLA